MVAKNAINEKIAQVSLGDFAFSSDIGMWKGISVLGGDVY
jgi:hypothetical protein